MQAKGKNAPSQPSAQSQLGEFWQGRTESCVFISQARKSGQLPLGFVPLLPLDAVKLLAVGRELQRPQGRLVVSSILQQHERCTANTLANCLQQESSHKFYSGINPTVTHPKAQKSPEGPADKAVEPVQSCQEAKACI